MKLNPSIILLSLLVLIGLTACNPNTLYETNIPVANERWDYKDIKTFTVDVRDTNALYNVYINVRHSFLFDWRNMYVQVSTQLPDGKKMEKRVNLPLCEADGKWFGTCLGDNCDLPVMIQQGAKFPEQGKYTFCIRQDMRSNPLDKIKSIGLRVEKSVSDKQKQ